MWYFLMVLLWMIVGGAAAIFFLGIPRAYAIAGTRVEAPAGGGDPATTVVVSLSEGFLGEVLGTVFRDLGPPTFNLSSTTRSGVAAVENAAFQGGCANSVI